MCAMWCHCICPFCGFRCISCRSYMLYPLLFCLISDTIYWQHRSCWNRSSNCSTRVRTWIYSCNCNLKGTYSSYVPLLCHSFPLAIRYVFTLHVCLYVQSGGTPETRNGLLEVQKAFRDAGLDFSKQVLTSGSFFLLACYLYIEMANVVWLDNL